jgi:hypothetical protein
LTVEGNINYDTVSAEDLTSLHNLGFKLVPLNEKSKPAIDHWTPIYENPDYWTPKRLAQESYKFKNVATVFGKTRLKDQQGRDLYLNELDVDSQKVYNILFNLKNGNAEETKTYSLIPLMQERSVVIKTRKPYGFRMSWLSHEQNRPIHTTDCKQEYEFEIKTDKSSGHSTLHHSRHRDDPNFHYKNIGQQTLWISDDLYDKLMETLAECLQKKSKIESAAHKYSYKTGGITTIELNDTEMQIIRATISPLYKKGCRHRLVFGLCGLFHKFNVSRESTLGLIQILAKDDEEKSSRIATLEETYEKDAGVVVGSKWFLDALEHATRDHNIAKDILDKILVIGKGDVVLRLLSGQHR